MNYRPVLFVRPHNRSIMGPHRRSLRSSTVYVILKRGFHPTQRTQRTQKSM